MTIPQATHLQFLVLDQIATDPGCSVARIRGRLAEHGVGRIGSSFYLVLECEGLKIIPTFYISPDSERSPRLNQPRNLRFSNRNQDKSLRHCCQQFLADLKCVPPDAKFIQQSKHEIVRRTG